MEEGMKGRGIFNAFTTDKPGSILEISWVINRADFEEEASDFHIERKCANGKNASGRKHTMPVYMLAEAKLKDLKKYNQYIAALSDIIPAHGGRYLVRGGRIKPLFRGRELERRNPDRIIIIEFPSEADHGRCFTSPEYQDIVPLRDAGAEIRAVLVQGYVPEKR
jgi:uncharacterized protein (DUF1330 family)